MIFCGVKVQINRWSHDVLFSRTFSKRKQWGIHYDINNV